MKRIISDIKEFKKWWNGDGIPVWFFILTFFVFFIIGLIILICQ